MENSHNESIHPPLSIPQRRVLVGLGGPQLERAILPVLQEAGDLVIERALTGTHLLERAHHAGADAALLASDLPGLDLVLLADLQRADIPTVIIAPDSTAGRWAGYGIVLPPDTASDQIRAALDRAIRGEQRDRRASTPHRAPVVPSAPSPDRGIAVIAVASGAGSPGRTTVALGLAAALGTIAPTLVVDADLDGPSLAAHLDADPTRNLFMLVHGWPREPGEWDRALDQEVQQLDPRSPHGAVLCGVPKPAMRAEVTSPFFERALAELRTRYRYVILDVGADLLGSEAAIHRAALGMADQILLVGSADIVGLSRLRAALDLCRSHLAVDPSRLALVVNRHDRRRHHRRAEIEWAFGTPLAALVPHDYDGIQRALAAQRPTTLVDRCAAGRALFALAERAHAGRIALPPDPHAPSRWWRRALPDNRTPGSSASTAAVPHDMPHRRVAWFWLGRATTSESRVSVCTDAAPRATTVPVGDKGRQGRGRGKAQT